jgi:hypothetical protein
MISLWFSDGGAPTRVSCRWLGFRPTMRAACSACCDANRSLLAPKLVACTTEPEWLRKEAGRRLRRFPYFWTSPNGRDVAPLADQPAEGYASVDRQPNEFSEASTPVQERSIDVALDVKDVAFRRVQATLIV